MPRGSPKRRGRFRKDRFTEKIWTPYVLAIGQASLAWNSLHESLAALFHLLLDRKLDEYEAEKDPRPIAIWHSANFDRPRRQMLKAIVETEKEQLCKAFPKFKDDILWLLKEIDKVENDRNNTVHSPLIYIHPSLVNLFLHSTNLKQIIPDVSHGNERAKALVNRHILSEYRRCRDASIILRNFTDQMITSLSFGTKHFSWPDRPSLPNRGQKKLPRRGSPPPG